MNHQSLAKALCGHYVPLSPNSGRIESPFTMPGDGMTISAYVMATGGGRLRVTDDGDVLFRAAVNGVEVTPSRMRQYFRVAEDCGINLSPNGELHRVCEEADGPYWLARLLEAASRVAMVSTGHRPRHPSSFDLEVGGLLEHRYNERLQRNVGLQGGSGHQLRFPFAIDLNNKGTPTVIQPIGVTDGRVDWSEVYKAAGKFQDLMANETIRVRRLAVLEEADDRAKMSQAANALAPSAKVVIYRNAAHLMQAIGAQ